MKEILKMWFFVRYFRKNQESLASRDKSIDPLVEEVIKTNGEWIGLMADAHIYTNKYMVAPYILKEQFIFYFFIEYREIKKSKKNYVDPKKFPRHPENLKYVNAIFLNCLSEKYNFFKYATGKDVKRIFITVEGEQFSTVFGLIKAEIVDLGPIWTIIITSGFWKSDWIISYLSKL